MFSTYFFIEIKVAYFYYSLFQLFLKLFVNLVDSFNFDKNTKVFDCS